VKRGGKKKGIGRMGVIQGNVTVRPPKARFFFRVKSESKQEKITFTKGQVLNQCKGGGP